MEIELRDYYLMVYGDNLVKTEGAKGTGIWYRRRWRWDMNDNILSHEVLFAVQTLYNDLLTCHEELRGPRRRGRRRRRGKLETTSPYTSL